MLLDRQVKRILEDPAIGTEKKGDLRGIYVHKFKLKTIQYLLAYRIVGENLELNMIGPHQNYYRDLKKYIKSTYPDIESLIEGETRGGNKAELPGPGDKLSTQRPDL